MEHQRWYDKDENLQLLFKLLQKLPLEAQNIIATELVQVVTSSCNHCDDFINELEYIPARHRWYDKSEVLHSAIKMLKKLSLDEREKAISEVFPTIVEFIHQNNESL